MSLSLWRPAKQLYAFLTPSMNTAGSASPVLLDFNNIIMQTVVLIDMKDESFKLR